MKAYTNSNFILLNIEKFDCWDFSGYFFMPFIKNTVPFSTYAQFIFQVNYLMDEIGVPQRSFKRRKIKDDKPLNHWGQELILEESDSKSFFDFCSKVKIQGTSFLIHVLFRQNATWQGFVSFGKEKLSFRSEMELLDILHQLLADKSG